MIECVGGGAGDEAHLLLVRRSALVSFTVTATAQDMMRGVDLVVARHGLGRNDSHPVEAAIADGSRCAGRFGRKEATPILTYSQGSTSHARFFAQRFQQNEACGRKSRSCRPRPGVAARSARQ